MNSVENQTVQQETPQYLKLVKNPSQYDLILGDEELCQILAETVYLCALEPAGYDKSETKIPEVWEIGALKRLTAAQLRIFFTERFEHPPEQDRVYFQEWIYRNNHYTLPELRKYIDQPAYGAWIYASGVSS